MLIVLYDRLDISVHLIFCSLYAYVCIYRVGQKVKPIFLRAQRYASAVLTMALSRRLSKVRIPSNRLDGSEHWEQFLQRAAMLALQALY